MGNVYQHSKCLLRGSLNLNQVIKIKKKSAPVTDIHVDLGYILPLGEFIEAEG